MMSPNTRKETVAQKRKVDHEDDRLSNLPSEILTKILSHLTIDEVVRSGILSTQWKSVWLSVPVLDVSLFGFKLKGKGSGDDVLKNIIARMSKFMDQVLISHKLPSLEKLCVWCERVNDPYLIKSWIQAALERDVRTLRVHSNSCSVDPPCCELTNVLSCNKLVVLKLWVDMSLDFPTMSSSCFPNLKVLELGGVYYKNDESLPNLLSGCPVLEDLDIRRSTWDNIKTLSIISSSLKRLSIRVSSSVYEAADLLVIDAPAIEFLDIECGVTREHVLNDVSSLVEANLCFEYSTNYNPSKLLAAFSNVKVLKLDQLTVEDAALADLYHLPIFHKLIKLEIYGHADDIDCLDSSVVLRLLKSSPLLEILILGNIDFSPNEELDVPSCLISHLKTIEIEVISDVEMAKYFLMNGISLEKMTINTPFTLDKLTKLKLCDIIFEREVMRRSTRSTMTWTWSESEYDQNICIDFLVSNDP